MMKKLRGAAVAACLSIGVLAAGAANASTGFDAPVAGWLVQDYPAPQGVVLWYTPSSCGNGQLVFNSSDSQVRQNRLVAMVLAAKAAGGKMHITYDVVNGGCVISDFGVIPS
ncbi:hypothetical protein [Luteibacter aegosomatissinici]|uniref:hypothetical protein n=1 Tax=Luteibacter aegosomatissinici TaxID=2911539 RepID=UPI001FF7C100|nr:hypothetical protein [Luteibacter aegosomatissinici]UPG95878.1 hypothetical protein L2Y97_07165 [Luteibacter aegosomatissinici]